MRMPLGAARWNRRLALWNDRLLRSLTPRPVTSYAIAGDRGHVLAAGCTGYIEKPIDPDTFKQEIEEYVNARPSGGGSRA